MLKRLNATAIFLLLSAIARADDYPTDDAHNHDGSHPPMAQNCGANYMLPGEVARLGSHSFMILGADGDSHLIAEHRSGTPPHNYQFLFRVRVDAEEMNDYKAILKDSKTLPAFTTIYYDENKVQKDRTFFCLADLPKIFGNLKKPGDEFEKLFPIRASMQKNPDHEGGFEIEKSVVKGKNFTFNRDDFEIIFYRYLPAYLPQDSLRKLIKEKGAAEVALLSHNPVSQDEPTEPASRHASFMAGDGSLGNKGTPCPANYYLKNVPMPETIHSFLLLAELDKNTILATHFYDQAPQNYQTAVELKVSEEEMKIYRQAKSESSVLPLFQTKQGPEKEAPFSAFCMDNLRTLQKTGKLALKGMVYSGSDYRDFKLGKAVGKFDIPAANVKVLVNRRLESLMNLPAVIKDVQKH